jgi:hypothetical protein
MTFQKGHIQFNTRKTHFKKGHISWLKGTKGLVKSNSGSFRKGHNAGKLHENYKGGLCFDKNKKRWLIWCRDNKYVLYSHAVFEGYTKNEIRKNYIVHHVDGNSQNDELYNLQLMTRSNHVKLHKPRLKKIQEKIK